MRYLSWVLIVVGLGLLLYIFGPVAKELAKYEFDRAARVKYKLATEQTETFAKPLFPPTTEFSIVIPKIAAVAPIVPDVDPTSKFSYLKALKEGVAHARGSAVPGEFGNVYLFAHSTDAFYNVGSYNAVFFLLGKMEAGDEILVFYRGSLFRYEVYEKKVVAADAVEYLGTLEEGEKTLTLQTCYPPGTTLKRLIVLAKEVSP
ncbi:MAG TPA: sortase [Patescibacteria group bacterium]|nr:sortase [Patescibacteria group bacterium]